MVTTNRKYKLHYHDKFKDTYGYINVLASSKESAIKGFHAAYPKKHYSVRKVERYNWRYK